MESEQKLRNQKIIVVVAMMFVFIAGLTGIYLLISSKQDRIAELGAQNTSINQELEQRDSVLNELVGAFYEIENNLDSIKMKRNQLSLMNTEGNANQKDRIINDINLLSTLLDQSHSKVAQLEKKLESSGIEMRSFRNKIATLTQNIEEQNAEIIVLRQDLQEVFIAKNELDQKIVIMETVISLSEDTIMKKNQIILQKEKELNTAHIAFGTNKELKEKGLLIKDSGFLGIGKAVTNTDASANELYAELDIRNTKSIPLNSKKAKIISDHPANSYRFVEEDGLITSLEIDNPAEFWRISKYALIETR